MKQFKFNEQDAIEKIIKTNFVDVNNITNTIYSLAKYNYHVLKLSDKDNYNNILKYITNNCFNVFEENIYKDIEGCIKNAKKHTLVTIDKVCITEKELKTIRSLDNIKQEKIMFVLLAVSKYFNMLSENEYDAVFMNNADICKFARVTIPAKDRDEFMQFAYDKELLFRHTWCDSTIKKLTFISHDDNDNVIMELSESDFKDLAYTYLAYYEKPKFRRCVGCKCWIRVNKQDKRLCRECSDRYETVDDTDNYKTVTCIDCGTLVYVNILNTETCRCDVCYQEYRKEYKAQKEKERRARLKNVDSAFLN